MDHTLLRLSLDCCDLAMKQRYRHIADKLTSEATWLRSELAEEAESPSMEEVSEPTS
jgi:hypothetical protein